MNNATDKPQYGHLDTSYKTAGEFDGLFKLCTDFYDVMNSLEVAAHIRQMHTDSLDVIIDKLTLFLSMWLGGPKTFREKYDFVGMPGAHKHLIVGDTERDAWLICMDKAVDKQNYPEDFKVYFKYEIRRPAEMIRKYSK
jgi:hemoglobin